MPEEVFDLSNIMLIFQIIDFCLLVISIFLLLAYFIKVNKVLKDKKVKSIGILSSLFLINFMPNNGLIFTIIYGVICLLLFVVDICLIVLLIKTKKPVPLTADNTINNENKVNQAEDKNKNNIEEPKTINNDEEEKSSSLKDLIEYAKKSSVSSISKNEIGKTFKKVQPKVIAKLRKNYTSSSNGQDKGLLLADTYYKTYYNKQICFAYVYELDTHQVFLLLRVNNKDIDQVKKTYPSLLKTKFPKEGSDYAWYRIIADPKYIKSNDELIKLLEIVYNLTK